MWRVEERRVSYVIIVIIITCTIIVSSSPLSAVFSITQLEKRWYICYIMPCNVARLCCTVLCQVVMKRTFWESFQSTTCTESSTALHSRPDWKQSYLIALGYEGRNGTTGYRTEGQLIAYPDSCQCVVSFASQGALHCTVLHGTVAPHSPLVLCALIRAAVVLLSTVYRWFHLSQ